MKDSLVAPPENDQLDSVITSTFLTRKTHGRCFPSRKVYGKHAPFVSVAGRSRDHYDVKPQIFALDASIALRLYACYADVFF